MAMAVERQARAKINLALHVTGQRADGYHLLDSLVAFADLGDTVTARPAPDLSLVIDGPMAPGLDAGPDNLVLRAARLFQTSQGAAIRLTKRLPLASGIGGGSADAAATLHALSALWSLPLPAPQDILTLGADLPVCLAGRPARMQGIGDLVTPLASRLPPAWLVLVNPGLPVATPEVFRRLASRTNPPLPDLLPPLADLPGLVAFLTRQRNDLAAPAQAAQPAITQVLTALSATDGALLARMSGSGATCFGLYAREDQAHAAEKTLTARHPGWWVAAAPLAQA